MRVWIQSLLVLVFLLGILSVPALATSSSLVISQVYVGTGSPEPTNVYVELFNKGSATVDLSNWTLQYATEGVNMWQAFPLSGNIAPGQYYLIYGSSTAGGSVNLPQADLNIVLNLPMTVGKLAIVNSTSALSTGCSNDAVVVDVFGYGNTTCFEARPMTPPDANDLFAMVRKNGGCTDTDVNFNDFSNVTPIFRNSSSPLNYCGGANGNKTLSLSDGGQDSFQTSGGTSAVPTIGYARIQPDSSSVAPAGVAIYDFRQKGILVSETGVPSSSLLTSGMLYVEVAGFVTTGLAIANPNNDDITFSYTITDSNDVQRSLGGSFVMAANTQMARFLTDWPFAQKGVTGILTFTASEPVAVTTLRGLTNERGEFLVSTLPVLDPNAPAPTSTTLLPHFAVGGGWRTEVILINTGGVAISGTVNFLDSSGSPITVPVGAITANSVTYTIPQNRTVKFVLPNTASSSLQQGVIQIIPVAGGAAPIPLAVFAYNSAGIRVSEATVMGLQGSSATTYVENFGQVGSVGSIQSGVAIASADGTTATVNLEVFRANGMSTGLTATIPIPANGKVAKFVNDIFPTLPNAFKGTLRISAPNNTISVAGLRARFNERGDFLITTVPVIPQSTKASSAEVDFPHIVNGGGYTTQFVLINPVAGKNQTSTGNIRLRTVGGQLLDLTFQ